VAQPPPIAGRAPAQLRQTEGASQAATRVTASAAASDFALSPSAESALRAAAQPRPAIRIVQEWEGRDDPAPYKVIPDSELPVIGQARFYGQEFPMKRFCGFPPTPEFTGDLEEMSLLAGESVGQTNRLMSAASIIDEMINGAEAVIRKRLGSMVVD
jgi:hypothetical protein